MIFFNYFKYMVWHSSLPRILINGKFIQKMALSYEGSVFFMTTDYKMHVLSGHYIQNCIKNAPSNTED